MGIFSRISTPLAYFLGTCLLAFIACNVIIVYRLSVERTIIVCRDGHSLEQTDYELRRVNPELADIPHQKGVVDGEKEWHNLTVDAPEAKHTPNTVRERRVFRIPKHVNHTKYVEAYVKHLTPMVDENQCVRIFEGNETEISRVEGYVKFAKFRTFPSYPMENFVNVVGNCSMFLEAVKYPACSSKEERTFPLAFTILTHSNIEHVERLLRMIYCPQNTYCIHVDQKAHPVFFEAIRSLVKCFPNVFLPSERVRITYAHFTRLQAEMNCIKELLDTDKSWKYYYNLASTEIPIKTNMEMVRIAIKLNGHNDIEEVRTNRDKTRYKFKTLSVNDELVRSTIPHPPPPHNLNITKGLGYGVFNRKMLEFAFTDEIARDFYKWCNDTFSPDEQYWSTLNNLYDNPRLTTPGGSKDKPGHHPFSSRYLRWRNGKADNCNGVYRHNLCVFGTRDLQKMHYGKYVANKFDVEVDPVAYSCMENFLERKRRKQYSNIDKSSVDV